jgi:hypothetical protein
LTFALEIGIALLHNEKIKSINRILRLPKALERRDPGVKEI